VAKRFRSEAITVARLSHPGIATIYELFEHGSEWLMVMEFVRGETLENMIARMGALSAQRAAEFCMQALAALAHAHSMGVVHRDLKPANLMVTENGTIKVMDFGIARSSGDQKPAAAPSTSPQQAGKGVVAGVVVSSDAGRPIRRAKVAIEGGTPRVSKTIQTDEQGAFRFTQLPAGDFTLTASKGGYVETIFGQRQPGSGRPGTPIHLVADQQIPNVSMPLARGAVITGAVYDEAGEPMFGESVRLYRWVMASGERTLQDVESATTDDRGIYRFAALRGGDYLVSTTGTLSIGKSTAQRARRTLNLITSSVRRPAISTMVIRGSSARGGR
jgi:hypothetical protein